MNRATYMIHTPQPADKPLTGISFGAFVWDMSVLWIRCAYTWSLKFPGFDTGALD